MNELKIIDKSQRFSKIKRAATPSSKPTQCSTFAFAQPANNYQHHNQ